MEHVTQARADAIRAVGTSPAGQAAAEAARRFYNANVADYNRRVYSIPSLLVARFFGYREVPFFQVEAAVEETPVVRF